MSSRISIITWNGSLTEGSGSIELTSSGRGTFDYSLPARATDEPRDTGPEELLAAAYGSCYAMQLSALLNPGAQGSPSLRVRTEVTQGGPESDFAISAITLTVEGRGVDRNADEFADLAGRASTMCPVGRALSGVHVTVNASLPT
jgi:osmotically inducible protein OsmC